MLRPITECTFVSEWSQHSASSLLANCYTLEETSISKLGFLGKEAKRKNSSNSLGVTGFTLQEEEKERLSINLGLASRIKMDDWLEFFGYWLVEGTVVARERIMFISSRFPSLETKPDALSSKGWLTQ